MASYMNNVSISYNQPPSQIVKELQMNGHNNYAPAERRKVNALSYD